MKCGNVKVNGAVVREKGYSTAKGDIIRINGRSFQEGFFSMFGMLTGTASNGMILLREIDPKFETPAANNLVLQSLAAIVFGFPVLLLMGFAPQSLRASLITLGVLVVFWVALTLFMLRTEIFRKKSKHKE